MRDHTLLLPQALLEGSFTAQALLRGDGAHPQLLGEVFFFPWQSGALVLARLTGLPEDGLYTLHVHAAGACQTGGDIPFYRAGPRHRPGPHTAVPALASGGSALSLQYAAGLVPEELTGRSLVLHRGMDAGRIACGVITAANRR